MLQPVYYIIHPEWLQQLPQGRDYVLDCCRHGSHDMTSIYRLASQEGKSFCLYLNGDLIQREAAEKIMAFFFLPGYLKQGGDPVIVIADDRGQFADLEQQARKQGFSSLCFIGPKAGGPILAPAMQQHEAFQAAYTRMLMQPASDSFFIELAAQDELTKAESLLAEAEQQFRASNGALFRLKKENGELNAVLQQMKAELASAETEIAYQQSHIGILRSGAQARDLQHYYNNEYEILPSWYKKVGHLIKAIHGKRSFRSLFSDNARKYKNNNHS